MLEQSNDFAAHAGKAHGRLAIERLVDALFDVVAEKASGNESRGKIEAAFHQCLGEGCAALLQPVGKTRYETDFHSADRHIEQMIRATRAVGNAAAEPFF